ncbi:MAG: lysophospholipid acyltransferase family protein [Sphaerochaetaceae bacterium]|nr:1-acyl-sn-glycerol-3-phosphate acyltransferase [Candidatus Cloacimonadota bacterium]
MLKYIHIVLAVTLIVIGFIISVFVAIIPSFFMLLFKKERAYLYWMRLNGTNISRLILWSLRVNVIVEGKENIPEDNQRVCFVSNHQSMLDIPLVLASLRIWPGFITKSELKKVPILNSWIKAMNSVYIDRKSPRSSLQAIIKGSDNIKKGIPMFIFPEGTRSKTGELGKFKTGSLKLATKAKATIVPITIEGSALALERKTGIKRTTVHVSVAKPIESASLDEQGIKELPLVVFGSIEKQFKKFNDSTVAENVKS